MAHQHSIACLEKIKGRLTCKETGKVATFAKPKPAREGVTVNAEQQLYCIPAGGGYSCLGFDNAFSKAEAVARWVGRSDLMPNLSSRGTPAGYKEYDRAMAAASAHSLSTGQRCEVELVPQLKGLEGKRVEVVDKHGETRRFIVGKSTGWMPCHLEISRRGSSGGGCVYGAPFKSVRVI